MMIASLSKPITAVAVMVLIREDPDVKLDKPFYPLIQNRFPTAGAGVDEVTVRQLLTHRGGLDWRCDLPDGDPNRRCRGCNELADLLAEDAGEVGTFFYSNTNFCLLRELIEEQSGQSYVDYVTQKVLTPMGITDMTCVPDSDNPVLYYGSGFTASRTPGDPIEKDYRGVCSAYGWYGSAVDLARFLAHLRFHTVLTKDETDDMLDGQLGIRFGDGPRGDSYGHSGGWFPTEELDSGFKGGMVRFSSGVDAVLLSNTRDPDDASSEFSALGVLRQAHDAAFQ